MTALLPVLLAGGSGTRLWPLSREQYPKQFLKLISDLTLLQSTAKRALAIEGTIAPLVLCGVSHRFIVAEQLRDLGVNDATIILEPEARNTAPAAAIAAHYALDRYGSDCILLLLPADQSISDQTALNAAVKTAVTIALSGKIVTFGITPNRPETGYGYIRSGNPIGDNAFEISRFIEKPDLHNAQQFLNNGNYYWNSGIFVFQATSFIAELKRFEPATDSAARLAVAQRQQDLDFIRLDADIFAGCRATSVDYAIMEHTDRAALVPFEAGWDDIGSWRFLDNLEKDINGNVEHGDTILESATNNLVSANSRLVAVAGVDNTIIIETKDAVLVTSRDHVQDVKQIVDKLRARGRPEVRFHPKVSRPWGSYETISAGERFQVKRLIVKPGQKLSMQMHHHRAEHWVVVRGTARVHCADNVFLMKEDESTYIPLGKKHRLENPGQIDLEVIEVQSGSYLGEDDIVRFDDVYGRLDTKN